MTKQKDHFKDKAKDYEKEVKRVNNVQNIADCILKEFTFTQNMNVMDFGSGTGLLTSKVAPYVKAITCVDMSKSMNDVLREKKDEYSCELEILELDLSKDVIDKKFDSIISSMTIHHVEDVLSLFKKFHNMLNNNGTIALADLDTEDGSFHTKDTGVFHFGFDRDWFLQTAKEAGFKNLKIQQASIASKPYGDFPIFLLTGTK